MGCIGLFTYLLITISTAMPLNGWSTHPGKEIFPFFSWSLFSKVSNKKFEYSLLIHQLDGETFSEPRDMRAVDGLPTFKGSRSLSYKALQNVGADLRSKLPREETDLGVFEGQYFVGHDVDYEIVREIFDPVSRWRDGLGVLSRSTIGRFNYRGRSS